MLNSYNYRVTYVGVGESIAVGVGHDQHVNVHGVQKGGQGSVCAIISGNLRTTRDRRITDALLHSTCRMYLGGKALDLFYL